MAKKRKGEAGNGLGPWQHHGAMARATRTKSKTERRRASERRQKQKGWQ